MASSGDEARANGAAGADADSDSEWDFLLTAMPKAPQAPLNSQETKRCSRARCQGRIPISDARKQCQRCRDNGKRWAASEKRKAAIAARARAWRERRRAQVRANGTAGPSGAGADVPCARCKGFIPASDTQKTCQRCRDLNKRYKSSEKGETTKKRWIKSEKKRAADKRYSATEKVKVRKRAYSKQYFATEKGKRTQAKYRATEKFKANMRRYRSSEKGKAHNAKRMSQLTRSLHQMVRGVHPNPQSFRSLGLFGDNADAEAFFELTKTEDWMKTAPWGACTATTLPQTVLQIGHRIPKAWYRHDDDGEIKKCWSRTNLFAQCAVENTKANHRNILSQAQWLALKAIWPKQCAGMTDEQAWAWCRDNVDNATRRVARAAAKTAGPSDEAGPSDLRTVEDEEASSEYEGPVGLDAYDSDALVFSDDSGDDEAD